MFERYTEQARRAIFFARYEAAHQPADKISTAHVLVGLTRDVGSRADAVGALQANKEQLRIEVGIPLPPKTGASPLVADIPLDRNAKMLLAYAAQEAQLDSEYWIDTDHLLRAMLRFPNEASAALQSIHFDAIAAREDAKRHRREFPPNRTFYHRLFGSPFRAHRLMLLKLLVFLIVAFLSTLLIRWLN